MRWKTGILTVGIVGVVGLLAAMGTSYVGDRYEGEAQLTGPPATPELVARGAYLARLGDCAACHSIPGKPPYINWLCCALLWCECMRLGRSRRIHSCTKQGDSPNTVGLGVCSSSVLTQETTTTSSNYFGSGESAY